MVHSDAIWNDILELERKCENKDDKWCIMLQFDTIWPTETILKAMNLNGALWRFLRPMLGDF